MENSTSSNEKYIPVPNNVIRNVGSLGGVDVFRLYAELLLQRNWRNEAFVTPNLLLKQLGRSAQYWRKQLRVQLQTLVDKGLVSTDRNIEDLSINDYFNTIISYLPGAATEIKCVNVEIFKLQSSVNVNTLYAVFAYIKMVTDKDTGFARVSMETVANGLGQTDKTVEKAIKVLEDSGFLRVTRGIYDPVKSQKMCNKYRVDDYNSLMWKVKHGLASFPERQALSAEEEAEAEINKKIAEVLTNAKKFSPCVFKGLPAKLFYEYYNTLKYESLFTISNIKDMAVIFEEYSSILGVSGGVIVLNFERLTNGIEDYVVAFLNNSVLPVVLLLGDETEITHNNLKSQLRYIFS